jgi:hypothetical protein
MPRGNKILIRTGSAAPSAADFATSEPAWDSSAGKLYVKNAAGSMVEVGAGGASSLAVYATTAGFPATGSATVLYLAEDTSRLFQWESGVYVEVGAAGGGFSHAASHAADGSDSLTLSAAQIGSGTLDAARLPASAVLTSDARLSDSRSPTSHSSSHASGGSDAITPASIGAVATTDGRLTKSLARFTARDNYPPATNFATLDTRNSILVLEFDAATEESATFIGVVNENAGLTNGLTVRLWWMGDTATSGNVRWGVQLEDTGTDLDADSYDTNAQVTSAASGTSGIESVASITITTIDSLAAGDRFRLRVYRVAADATNDTMAGDAQLVAVEVRAA